MSKLLVVLGAGFSFDAGLPLVKDFNDYFNRDITDKLRVFSSSEWFWSDSADETANHNGSLNRDHIVYAFVLQEVLDEYGQMHNYEDFYDFLIKKTPDWFKKKFDSAKQKCITKYNLKEDNSICQLFDQYQYHNILRIFNFLIIDLLVIKRNQEELTKVYSPFFELIGKYTSVRILTLNHDLLLENLMKINEEGFSDGFSSVNSTLIGDDVITRNDNPQLVFNDSFSKKIHVYKLHGAADIFAYNVGIEQGNTLTPTGEVIYFKPDSYNTKHFARRINPNTGEVVQHNNFDITPKFITGKDKLNLINSDQMYSTLYKRFAFETKDECDLLIIGYSFGDDHVNEILSKGSFKHITNVNPGAEYSYKNGINIKNLKYQSELKSK